MTPKPPNNEDTLRALGKLIPPDQDPPRDAVHVAVMPITAWEDLTPGQHVELPASLDIAGSGGKKVGIVDPFLKLSRVRKGERVWLFLYPGSITSLHHHWTHPAAEPPPPAPKPTFAWTEEMVALARDIRAKDSYVCLAALADLMEKAGYDDAATLAEARRAGTRASETYSRPHTLTAQRALCVLLGGELAEAVGWVDHFADKLGIGYAALMDFAASYVCSGGRDYYTQHGDESLRDTFAGPEAEQFWAKYKLITGEDRPKADRGDYDNPFSCSC